MDEPMSRRAVVSYGVNASVAEKTNALMDGISTAERSEEFAAGLTSLICPFCGERAAHIVVERDRQGVIGWSWACESCDESGPCVANGKLEWAADA
jgi:hypothetical protein